MAARKSASEDGVRSVKAVFVKELVYFGSKRTYKYVRQPFNLVEYDWGNGERTTGLELDLGRGHSTRELDSARTAVLSGTNGWEEYQDVLIFDSYAELRQWPTINRGKPKGA